ncbi:alternative sulfate transporter [Microdochium trichocladiopsis]|uniref:Alternative sulfate transporter n=1 Tax=Microdochium trichocladiopsis TaxID=1682393 RepID=A0A9P8Y2W8_9PEZI|nr:alternative sulfate transporter [Microdochium trichocladiopsis]KAH7028200.1 alternative sulfate transporter [Microdochium trichocladiopsis]
MVINKDWTDADERSVVRKLDFLLMPLLVLGFFALQLDRSNISNALTSTITTDLGVTRAEISRGNQLQLAGIIIAEIPANLLLQKIGSSLWLSVQCLSWGLIGTFQAFITNKSSYYATRFLLGFFEAGYIPGSMLLMSLFYTRKEIAVRTAVFYFGNYFSVGTGSLIAAGVLQLEGMHGWPGWRWLFLIDGSMTLIMCIAFVLLLPASPLQTLPLCRIKALDRFSDRERQIMNSRILLDDPTKRESFHKLGFMPILKTLADYRLWCHFSINLLGLVPKGGLQLYSPYIIKSLGFSTTNANALSSISNYGVCILSFAVSWASDATGWRGPWAMLTCAFPMVFAGVQFALAPMNVSAWTRFAIFTLLNSANGIVQTMNDAWLSSNATSHRQRSIGLAIAVIGSNLGGLAGQQLFQDSDAPTYKSAFIAVLCLYAASMTMIGVQMAIYWRWNKRAAARDDVSGQVDGTVPDAEQAVAVTSSSQGGQGTNIRRRYEL